MLASFPVDVHAAGTTIKRNHRAGETHVDIVLLQKFLNSHGFVVALTGPGSPGHETAFFGSRTLVALKSYQRSRGLPATGFAGPLTRTAIAVQSSAGSESNSTASRVPTIAPNAIPQPPPIFGYFPGFGGGSGLVVAETTPSTPADTTAPSTPTSLRGTGISTTEIDLSWSASTDDTAVSRYDIYRDGVLLGSATTTAYADTSAVASTTYRYVVKARDAAGNGSASSTATQLSVGLWDDGYAGASAAPIQHPTLLSDYLARSPWHVPGVDYAVGLSTTTTLLDPATIVISGVVVTPASHLVRVNSNNVTISGYDFSLDGGWQLYVPGNGVTITQNNFKIGANAQPPIVIAGAGATITYNTIDGDRRNTVYSGLMNLFGTGTFTVKYNWLKNSYVDFINAGSASQSQDIRFNLFENAGSGSASGFHADFLQDYGANNAFPSISVAFNTYLQNTANQATQGFNFRANQGSVYTRFDDIAVKNNTIVLPDPATVSENVNYIFLIDPSLINGTALIQDNFLDPTNVFYDWRLFDSTGLGPYAGTTTFSGNYTMLTGDLYASQSSSYPTRTTLTAPASGATVAGSILLSASADSSSGITSVQFKIDGTATGSALTSSPYVSTWNSASVADGTHTIASVARDTTGIYGTSSISVTVANAAPVISNVSSGAPTSTGTTVTWDTNTPSDSKVVYGLTSAYGSTTQSAALVTSHSLDVTALIPLSTYHYAVVSTDALGKASTFSDATFDTDTSSTYVGPGDLATGATAWWGLRAYSRAKTGSAAIIVTCGGTNYTINTLITGLLDTATLSSNCGANTIRIRQLYDQTGNGWHLLQTTQNNQATITLSCIGSLPCMTSTSTNIYTVASLSMAAPYTFAYAGNQDPYVAQANILSDFSQSVVFHFAASTIRTYDSASINHTVSDGSWHSVQTVLSNSSANTFTVDGTSSTYTGGSGRPALGGGSVSLFSFKSSGFGYRGKALEAGLWSGALATSTHASINTNSQAFWGW